MMQCRAVTCKKRSFLISVFITLCVCSVHKAPQLPPATTETNGIKMYNYTNLRRPATPSYVNSPAADGAGAGGGHIYETPVTSEMGKKYSFAM